MGDRFVVKEGSASGHCCFEASVVDTALSGPEDYIVCECLFQHDAAHLAKALNEIGPSIPSLAP